MVDQAELGRALFTAYDESAIAEKPFLCCSRQPKEDASTGNILLAMRSRMAWA